MTSLEIPADLQAAIEAVEAYLGGCEKAITEARANLEAVRENARHHLPDCIYPAACITHTLTNMCGIMSDPIDRTAGRLSDTIFKKCGIS